MLRVSTGLCAASILVLAACSPALNWRETRSDASPLRAQLPCKPDHALREVTMGNRVLQLDMQGCDAGGSTFAISHVRVDRLDEAEPLLAGWRTAVLAHLHAAQPHTVAFVPPGGWATPGALRLQASGRRADGAPLAIEAAWFARVDASGVHLFHAALYADRVAPEVAETFMSGLVLQ